MSDKTREQEIRDALGPARVPDSVFRLVSRLLDRADYGSAVIPDKFQFKAAKNGDRGGYTAMVKFTGLPRNTLIRAIEWGQDHGWVQVTRPAKPGRGHITTYQPQIGGECAGADCGCRVQESKKGTHSGTNKRYPQRDQSERERYPNEDEKGTHENQEVPAKGGVFTGGHLEGEVGGPEVSPACCRSCGAELHGGFCLTCPPVCRVCGVPISALRRAQTLKAGGVCSRCEDAGGAVT